MTGMAETPCACSMLGRRFLACASRVHARESIVECPCARRPASCSRRSEGSSSHPTAAHSARHAVVVRDRDRDPLVVARRRVDAVGRRVRVGVAEGSGVDAGACGLEVDLADEVGGGLGLGELEVLALARLASRSASAASTPTASSRPAMWSGWFIDVPHG